MVSSGTPEAATATATAAAPAPATATGTATAAAAATATATAPTVPIGYTDIGESEQNARWAKNGGMRNRGRRSSGAESGYPGFLPHTAPHIRARLLIDAQTVWAYQKGLFLAYTWASVG